MSVLCLEWFPLTMSAPLPIPRYLLLLNPPGPETGDKWGWSESTLLLEVDTLTSEETQEKLLAQSPHCLWKIQTLYLGWGSKD